MTTPIIDAIQRKDYQQVEKLLQEKESPNICQDGMCDCYRIKHGGASPLYVAMKIGDESIIAILNRHNAVYQSEDGLDSATPKEQTKIRKFLKPKIRLLQLARTDPTNIWSALPVEVMRNIYKKIHQFPKTTTT